MAYAVRLLHFAVAPIFMESGHAPLTFRHPRERNYVRNLALGTDRRYRHVRGSTSLFGPVATQLSHSLKPWTAPGT